MKDFLTVKGPSCNTRGHDESRTILVILVSVLLLLILDGAANERDLERERTVIVRQ